VGWLPSEKAPLPLRRTRFDIWQFQTIVSRRLLIWAGLNVGSGLWLQQHRDKFWRGYAMQAISWGAINAAIALVGMGATRYRKSRKPRPYAREVVEKEERNLSRALWINAGLDVFYVIGGILLAQTRGKDNRLMRGNGWGIVVQGMFLCLFDVIHAVLMNEKHRE
jgi:hypothetical protein